jgi:hypothetical protein
LAKKQIDLSFLSMVRIMDPIGDQKTLKTFELTIDSQLNIVCIESTRETTNGFKPLVCGPTGAAIAGGATHRPNLEIPDELEALAEVQTIDGRDNSIDGYFRVWLHELNAANERVRIHIDDRTAGDTKSSIDEFFIKCDLKEAMLDLNHILLHIQTNGNASRATNGLQLVPNLCADGSAPYDLHVIGLVQREGICDSVTYGVPYVLSANCSPQMSVQEVEDNWSRFYGLIDAMNQTKSVIVLELRQTSGPYVFFALLSSPDTKTILMKAIAAKELLLPYYIDSVTGLFPKTPSKAVVDAIVSKLNRFTITDVYNPLCVKNNLFQYLSPNGSNTSNGNSH